MMLSMSRFCASAGHAREEAEDRAESDSEQDAGDHPVPVGVGRKPASDYFVEGENDAADDYDDDGAADGARGRVCWWNWSRRRLRNRLRHGLELEEFAEALGLHAADGDFGLL